MRYNFIKLNTVDSTSVWARKNLSNLKDFDVVSADIQTEGRGQFERKWLSSDKNGGNVYISIVLKPENITHLNELTRFSSIMVSDILLEYGLKPDFKFPNDILINGRKICGILAESVFQGNEFKGVVTGIGINLNLDKEELDKIDIDATSIFNETGKNIDKEFFLNRLMAHFADCYDDFIINGIKSQLTYV